MSETSDDVEVKLTWAEMLVAGQVGVMRNIQCLKLGRVQKHYGKGGIDYWASNIEGAAGEMAVAKLLGIYWTGAVGDIKADDVGPYQVKTNTSRKWDDLIIQKENRPDRIYISVLSFVPRFIVLGWAWGYDVMEQEFWRDGLPGMTAYFVPRKMLRPMSELPPVEFALPEMQEAS